MDMASGVVGIEYSHFYVREQFDPWLEDTDQTPDFHTDEPVIITPGQITIISRVQCHDAWVTLMLTKSKPLQQMDPWQLLGTWSYLPVSGGLMGVWGVTGGPAAQPAGWLADGEGFTPTLQLDPAVRYAVHVYAKGRQDSRARFEAAMAREEWGAHEGFEDYVVAFNPTGHRPAGA
ncbi:hypothetical protein [Streptomyces sp. AP-93]|uniref:hypothetical protein n=1 Tax=Streptomyces sp. AP-93 TaxID=2929048 RepID=UPI001FAEE5B1|nr:hypothetical protein [Streptomyces sp. AP-93]MCJ0875453.1 hypothetical protein [Streptomyces sp. AP-93]